MLKKTAAAVALVCLSTWIGSAQDAKAVIASASAAIGVDQLRAIQYSATGFDFALGQSYNPESPWHRFINKSYTRAIDFQVPSSRVERVRLQGLEKFLEEQLHPENIDDADVENRIAFAQLVQERGRLTDGLHDDRDGSAFGIR